MLNKLLIAFGKMISTFSLTLGLGSGSTWPGHFALKTNRHFIKDLLKGSQTKVVLIAGTNGKTTTSTLITHILEANGKKVIQNTSGANLLNGIASTLLLHTNRQGTLDADYAIFEVDENAFPPLLKEITPDSIILLNLFRDQLDRYGEVNSIVTHWHKALAHVPKTTNLIVNGDDPEIAYLGLTSPATSYYFGLDDKKLGQTSFQHASDSIYCPKCHEKLTYITRYFSHLGEWSCAKCELKRPSLTVSTSPFTPLAGIYNIYNSNAAVLFAQNEGLSEKQITTSLQNFSPAFGRQEKITYYGKNVQLFLSKNPTSLNQSLRTCKELKATHVLFILNDRNPDGHDISWIWDVDFEDYITPNMHVFISGDRCFDMGLRLKYASSQSVIEPNVNNAINTALTHMPVKETLFILPNYSAMLDTRKILTGKKIL